MNSAERAADGMRRPSRPLRRVLPVLVGGTCLLHPLAAWGEYLGNVGSGLNGPVFAVVVSSGVLYAAGAFSGTPDGSVPLARIAKLAGSDWAPVGDLGTFGPIRCLLAHNDSLWVGGDLYSAGNTAVRGIAVWDGAVWAAMGAGLEGAVQCLGMYRGQLIAGGDFDEAGDLRCNGLARWDGSAWQPMGLGPHTGQVRALTVYGGALYVGGTGLDVPGVGEELQAVARWDGMGWSLVSGGVSDGEAIAVPGAIGGRTDWIKPASVMSMVEFEGQLIIGGQFRSAWNGEAELFVRGLVGWDGASYAKVGGASLLPYCDGAANVLALAVYQGKLCIGGYFQRVDLDGGSFVATSDFAVWDGVTWIDPDVSGFNDGPIHVSGLAVHNGCIVLGCRARGLASEQTVNYITRWAPGCTGVERSHDPPPARTELAPVAPNPANPRMRIAFELAEAGRIVVGVYNSAGRQVDLLADQRLPAGHHVALWDGTDLAGTPVASGVYQIVLRTDAGTFVRKATLVR